MVALSHLMDGAREDDLDRGIVIVAVVVVAVGEVVPVREGVDHLELEGPAGHAQGRRQHLKAELIVDQGPAPHHQNGPKGIRRRGLAGMAD